MRKKGRGKTTKKKKVKAEADQGNRVPRWVIPDAILEQYTHGPLHDLDSILVEGRWVINAAADLIKDSSVRGEYFY